MFNIGQTVRFNVAGTPCHQLGAENDSETADLLEERIGHECVITELVEDDSVYVRFKDYDDEFLVLTEDISSLN